MAALYPVPMPISSNLPRFEKRDILTKEPIIILGEGELPGHSLLQLDFIPRTPMFVRKQRGIQEIHEVTHDSIEGCEEHDGGHNADDVGWRRLTLRQESYIHLIRLADVTSMLHPADPVSECRSFRISTLPISTTSAQTLAAFAGNGTSLANPASCRPRQSPRSC